MTTSVVTSFDWNTSIKPLLAASHNNFSFSTDLFKLARSIESSKQEILNHEAEFEPFYSSFIALSTHYISSNFSHIPKNEMQSVLSACHACIDFILSRLEKHYDQTSVTSKQLLLLVKGMCKGYGCLQRSDAIKLTAVMKSFQLPPGVRATIGTEKNADETDSAQKARTRSDPLSEVVDCLNAPLMMEVFSTRSSKEKSPKEKKEQAKPAEQAKDFKDIFIQENINYLLRKNAGSLLIDVCLKLPFLSRYNLMTRDLFQGNMVFTTDVNECLGVQDLYSSLRTDIAAVSVVVTLPLLEPLNTDKLSKLCLLGCSCLLAACSVTVCNHVLSAASNDPKSAQEFEVQANRVLEKSLFVFSAIINIIQNSHNTGGTHLQNSRLLGSWCLLVGVRHLVQNYDVDSSLVALGQHLLDLLKPILIDLRTDPGKVEDLTELNINTLSTAWQKVKFLNQRLNIISVLLDLTAQSFSKALTVRRKPKSVTDLASKDGRDPIPDIDQYPDVCNIDEMLQTSGFGAPSDSEAETLLGNWLEEVMASVPPLIDSSYLMASERRRQASLELSCLGSSDDPSLYLNFSVGCLNALNDYIFSGTWSDFSDETFGFSWTERELSHIANMIRLIELQTTHFSTDSSLMEFNAALVRFTHNLLANGFLSGNDEVSLLAKLNVFIGPDLKDDWPLQLSPRLLGILGQILLQRQTREKAGNAKVDKEAVIVNIWERLIRSLQKKIFVDHDVVELVDVSVDHLQLLLILFHSLSLMPKKTVFLNTMQAISNIAREGQTSLNAKSKNQKIKFCRMSSHFSRILLIFDYMTRYFYEPPSGLLEQVKSNVYPLQCRSPSDSFDKNLKLKLAILPLSYFSCAEFEEVYRSATANSQQCKMKPLFYNLAPETSITDLYKLDGLATSFMLNYNEYADFYSSLIEIFNWDRLNCSYNDQPAFSTFFNGVYSFTSRIIWRMLSVLPPSVSSMQLLNTLSPEKMDDKALIMFLRFGARLSDSSFCNWLKDSLCKQKMNSNEADELVSNLSGRINSPKFLTELFSAILKAKISVWDSLPRSNGKLVYRYSIAEMISTDLILSRFFLFFVKHGEKDAFYKEFSEQANTFVQLLNQLTSKYHNLAKAVIIDEACCLPSDALEDTETSRNSIKTLMSVSAPCIGGDLIYDFGISCWNNAHSSIRFVMADWNRNEFSAHGFPAFSKNEQISGDAAVDGFLSSLYSTHLRVISESGVTLMITVQRLLYSSVFLLLHIVRKFRPVVFDLELCATSLIPLLVDISSNYFADDIYGMLTNSAFYGGKNDEELFLAINRYVCSASYDLIVQRCSATDNAVSPNITDVIVTYFENLLDKTYGREAVASVLEKIGDINFLLRATFSLQDEDSYKFKLIRLLTAVFKSAENISFHKNLEALCEKIIQALVEEFSLFEKWLNKFSAEPSSKSTNTERHIVDAQAFLEQLVKYLRRTSSPKAVQLNKSLLESLIKLFDSILNRLTTDFDSFSSGKTMGRVVCDFFYIMVELASAKTASENGHVLILKAIIRWIGQLKATLCSKPELFKQLVERQQNLIFDFMRVLLTYLIEALSLFRKPHTEEQVKITYDSDISGEEPEIEHNEEINVKDEDDESADESEDDAFDNKLCTFTLTQKEFMSQHWYHCHSCGMVDGEGVCSICAKVCHKGHDLSYSKFGSFFCDCGAKGGCQAMTKRVKQKAEKSMAQGSKYSSQLVSLPSVERKSKHGRVKRSSSTRTAGAVPPQKVQSKINIAFPTSSSHREAFHVELAASKKSAVESLLEMLQVMIPIVSEFSKEKSALGFLSKIRNELQTLHKQKKSFDNSENLAVATLASQDGAFENLKLSLTGDTGQTIKHLISSHIIQRNSICCLNGFDQKKHLLAVAHDRSKITIMHVSALLKQAEANQKKLTLTRSCSENLPFIILSMADNPMSNEFLAVCGFKELCVITISQSGLVNDRLMLQPPLEGGNYILKALWLPNSLTKLAAITADYVRIYDLSLGTSQTIFHFMLAAGKICDATFVCWERKKDNQRYLDIYLMLLSNSGHLYIQQINENFEYAIHGALFITTTIELRHSELTENAGVVSQGGSSVYYSTRLQTVFISFSNGKSFFFPLTRPAESVDNMFLMNWRSSMKSLGMQPLYRWAEPVDHPGIITALTHSNQNPVIFMINPTSVQYQELVAPSKAKVIDCVPIRYCSSYGEKKTVIALIGEDGGLRIFSINLSSADHWLPKPSLLSYFAQYNSQMVRKKRSTKTDKLEPPPFQVDFFESCQQLSNVEFGGNDLLQMYNYQLLKDRLEKNNTYVACGKVNGFQVEIVNNDGATIMCGLRIELGKRNVQKTPMYFEIFGRRQMVNVTRGRWFDFPFSREEAINAANRLTVTFGPSRDESKMNFVDSIKVYGKTRDSFGWNEDLEEYITPSNETEISAEVVPAGKISPGRSDVQFPAPFKRDFLLSEQMITSFFAALELYFALFSDKLTDFRKPTVNLVNSFFVTTVHPETLRKAKHVLRQVLTSRTDYYASKDQYILSYVAQHLQKLSPPVDPELYCLLISLVRNICVFRPSALNTNYLTVPKTSIFVELLLDKFWLIFDDVPLYSKYSAVGYGDINNCDVLVRLLVEILHAVCLSDPSAQPDVSKAYINLLFSKHFPVAFACRSALISVFRKNVKGTAPPSSAPLRSVASAPRPPTVTDSTAVSTAALTAQDNLVSALEIVDEPPGFDLVNAPVTEQERQEIQALLISADNGQPSHAHIYDLPSDADDEQHLVEIAIALSLQDQSADQQGAEIPHAQAVYALAHQQESMDQDPGHSSDTTASGMSDEEGSNAATEGSTLRISPAEERAREPRGSPESESPASVSGRSSTAGEQGSDAGISAISAQTKDVLPSNVSTRSRSSFDLDSNKLKNQQVLLSLIENFTNQIKELDKYKGVECISFLQVIATLVSCITPLGNNEKNVILRLIQSVINALRFKDANTQKLCERSSESEVHLLLLRLVSVFLSKSKGTNKGNASETDIFVSSATAKALMESEAIPYCLRILKDLKNKKQEKPDANEKKNVKKTIVPHSDVTPPDFSPLFLRSYVKEHSFDIFERYQPLLAEIVLRLPYQIKKVAKFCSIDSPLLFDEEWNDILCDLMRDQNSDVKKDVRKLLLFLSSTKERYRSLRDSHTLRVYLQAVQTLCAKYTGSPAQSKEIDPNRKLIMNYSILSNMMDYLKVMLEIATNRPSSWQDFCLSEKGALAYLVQLSCVVDDNVAVVILTLLQMAAGAPKDKKKASSVIGRREEKEKFKFSDQSAAHIAETLLKDSSNIRYLENSARYFLFSCNSSECRWQMHALLQAILESGVDSKYTTQLIRTMWNNLWDDMPLYGRKAAQFIDLLSYYTAKLLPVDEMRQLLDKVLKLLRKQNTLLTDHPNAYLYNSLSSLLEFDGYYLETNPCLVCNNPEVPMANLKLNSLKMDARFTTTSQMIKLVSSHEIGRIVLKISEARRSKTVKQLKLYYSNKLVPSAVELKNKPEIWSLAKTFTLSQSQSELKMEFAVPIVACNLMMEYADFYEVPSATPEALHCPRCSASVPANPGVCSNCNENVYQCHKCRAINYDEKDPFLCNSCGYSKYGKFDYTVYSRVVAGVEPIENEEDRKKTVVHINTLLEKADQLYRQLLVTRPQIETLLAFATGQESQNIDDSLGKISGSDVAVAGLVSGLVNRSIQLLALKYNRDCRLAFEDLSKIVQKLIANKNELIEYDRKQRELSGLPPIFSVSSSLQSSSDCFGCAAATAQQCILMVRAMTLSNEIRHSVSNDPALINQLVEVALKQGSVRSRQASRELICSITKDQKFATQLVCETIEARVTKAMAENISSTTLSGLVQGELQLLFATLQVNDDCWEIRIRSVFKIFLRSLHAGTASIEAVTLPCLTVFQTLFATPTKDIQEKQKYAIVENRPKTNVFSWLTEGETSNYADFVEKIGKGEKSATNQLRKSYLLEKYGRKWLKFKNQNKESQRYQWLDKLLFCLRSSQTRNCTAYLLEQLCTAQPMRRAVLLDMLTSHLANLEQFGDRAHDFVNLYQNMIKDDGWKLYLVVRKVLPLLGHLISQSVENLNKLESTSLSTDMSRGYALKVYCDLLLSLLQVETVRKNNKKQLIGIVLHSYLGLKRLLVQRTKLIDDAQSKLLQLLELLTTGTEIETEEFIRTCIRTAKKYPVDDLRTPLFIFERLCSTIHPEEKEIGEFLINVEKDAAQDDFLQGRMMGNPYKSTDAGMGPLMRDIKNKICRDCDLISLLEDDTGMELLVNGKIISLDLPVAEVFKKIWQPQHPGETMLIVYRMRGLLGDATEEFVESLQSKKTDKVNEEETFKRGRIVGECGGLELMLDRFKNIKSIHVSTVLPILLTLFDYCIRVRDNRIRLLDEKTHSIEILLRAAKTLLTSNEVETISLGEKTLGLVNRILSEPESIPERDFEKFCENASATDDDFQWLLTEIYKSNVQSNNSLKDCLLQTIVNLALGSEKHAKILIKHFEPTLKFELYDAGNVVTTRTAELDAFCSMISRVQASKYGLRLKDKFKDAGFVSAATSYLIKYCPPLFKVGSTLDSPDWKEFLGKSSLKYVLRMLTGLCQNHEATQLLVAEECIPIIHRLEQISSEERVGSLAENLMEVLKSNEKVAKKIEEVREETKTKKRNLAMAMRQKQLTELGMTVSEKGQVRSDALGVMKNVGEFSEEPGLTCSICQEGYKLSPQKLLGIYTYTKRSNCDDFEAGSKKTPTFSTVSHFNAIHFDCHTAGVRSARGRDEWESATLQNANTKCNGLLPVYGMQISDADFAAGLAKHNSYIQDHTGIVEINLNGTIQDLKLLLLRFAFEKSFSEEAGGGGRESNIHLLPFLASICFYLLTQTQAFDNQMARLTSFINMPPDHWMKNAFECEGATFYTTCALIVFCPDDWNRLKINLLRRLIVTAQARNVSPDGAAKQLKDKTPKPFKVYKPYLILFAFIDKFYSIIFQEVKAEKSSEWPAAVQTFIRANDAKLIESTNKLLKHYEQQLIPCETFVEFCDVSGLFAQIPNPDEFFASSLEIAV